MRKTFIIKWQRELSVPEFRETVVRDIDKSYAVSRFLRYHNASLEKIEIVEVKEVTCIERTWRSVLHDIFMR